MGHKITAIFVTFNRLEYTKQTLNSFFMTKPEECDQVIVVDNLSTDGTREYLTNLAFDGKITLLLNTSNRGWGEACNIGILSSHNEFILLSNNDVIYKLGWYEQSMILYSKYNIGVLGLWKHPSGHTVIQELDDLVIKDQMPGVALVLRKDFINRVGGIPSKGPCLTQGGNGEDVELCIKAKELNMLVCGPKDDLVTHIPGN